MDTHILEKLIDVSRSLAEERMLEPLLERAMTTALNLFNGEYGYLILLTPAGEMDFRVRQDWRGNRLSGPEAQVSHTIFDQVIAKRQPLLTADAVMDPDLLQSSSIMSLRLRSVVCVPLIVQERVLGALYMENRSDREIFDRNDLKVLGYFAAHLAVSLRQVQPAAFVNM